MPGAVYQQLVELAADQYGYVTTQQAEAAAIGRNVLTQLARRGVLERVSWGVYRVPLLPIGPLDQYMEATLWPQGVRGVLSHETALNLYELSDVNPAKIHLTVPRRYRTHRQIPGVYVLHQADLPKTDVTLHEGLPITTPVRTIHDCHAAQVSPALLAQALADGRRTGRLTRQEVDILEREIFGRSAQPTG